MINKGKQHGVTECGGRSNGCPTRMLSSCMCAASPSFFPDRHSACRAVKFPNPRLRMLPQALPPADNKKVVPGCSEHDFAKTSSAVLTPMVAAKKTRRFHNSAIRGVPLMPKARPRASSACAEQRSFWNARRFSARRNASNVFCRTRQTALQAKPACVGIFRPPG